MLLPVYVEIAVGYLLNANIDLFLGSIKYYVQIMILDSGWHGATDMYRHY